MIGVYYLIVLIKVTVSGLSLTCHLNTIYSIGMDEFFLPKNIV